MSDPQEPPPPKKAPFVPGQPLPRTWKAEPDGPPENERRAGGRGRGPSDRGEDEDGAAAGRSSAKAGPKSKEKARSKSLSKSKSKLGGGDEDDKEKRVLLEETPTFDTVEARQRVRMAIGAVGVLGVLATIWILYGLLAGQSGEIAVEGADPSTMPALVETPTSLDGEARYLLNRARDYARAGRTDHALSLLKRIITAYKGTQSAAEARQALDRPRRKLPLFPDKPTIVVENEHVPPTIAAEGPRAAPTIVVGNQRVSPTSEQLNGSAAMPPLPGRPPDAPPRAAISMAPPPAPGQAPPMYPPSTPRQAVPARATSSSGAPSQHAPAPAGVGDIAALASASASAPPGTANATIVGPDVSNGRNAAPDTGGAAPGAPAPRKLPPGFQPKVEAGYDPSGWPLIIVCERDGAPMVLVPGGTFTMGSDRGEAAEGPAHTVRMSTFYLDQHEVTNQQFRAFVNDTRYRGRPPGKWLTDPKLRDRPADEPAVRLSWRDAENYALWTGRRLPTEAQWEHAGRSSDGRLYPWGDRPARSDRPVPFPQIAAVMGDPEDVTPGGIFDLAGNAAEWTRDWYDPRAYETARGKILEDPVGPTAKHVGTIRRVVKGGAKDGSLSHRQGIELDRRLPNVGFRCVVAVEGPEASAMIAPRAEKPAKAPGPPGSAADAGAGGQVPF